MIHQLLQNLFQKLFETWAEQFSGNHSWGERSKMVDKINSFWTAMPSLGNHYTK
jgi:hypothetical protein